MSLHHTTDKADRLFLPYDVWHQAVQLLLSMFVHNRATAAAQRQLQLALSPETKKAYTESPEKRKILVQGIVDTISKTVKEPEYKAWSNFFDDLLKLYVKSHSNEADPRFRRGPGSSSGAAGHDDPIPGLREGMQTWAENRRLEVRIRLFTLKPEEKEEVVHGMEDTVLYFQREVMHTGLWMRTEHIREIAGEYGAFKPLPAHQHEHAQVQRSLSHMTPRQHARYFSGAASAAGRVGGGGW